MRNFSITCLIFCSIVLFAVSCSKRNQAFMGEGDYIVFGHFYGFCKGEHCIEIFKLTNDQLYEDKKDEYPSAEKAYEGDFQPMSREKFNKVKSLMKKVPPELLQEEEHRIGAPDAADQGGIYFEYSVGGKKHFWLIDQANESIPEYLRSFKETINNSIEKISDAPEVNNPFPDLKDG